MTDARAGERAAAPTSTGAPRILGVSGYESRILDAQWTLCSARVGAHDGPAALDASAPAWQPAVVPGTVAAAQRAQGGLDLERAPDYDASEWWYLCRFSASDRDTAARDVLCFDGLATLADVWLNGTHVLSSDNMFVAHEVDVTDLLARENDLVIRFRSLRAALETRRPRPKWRTKLVEHQQLRWHRTTLLGRMPGWSPPVRAVGPWRAVRLERRRGIEVIDGGVYAAALERGGVVRMRLGVRALSGEVTGATLRVAGLGEQQIPRLARDDAGGFAREDAGGFARDDAGDFAREDAGGLARDARLEGELVLPGAEHWWPHTHGAQPRYDTSVVIHTTTGEVTIDFGKIAFRRVAADTVNDGFALEVNGVRVFCRGACWTTPDIVTLGASEKSYRSLLTLARDAGMNMIRVGGTMVYEADCFYDLCDELGILVWQEFMFANMDYPAGDARFVDSVVTEATQLVARLRNHPCIAVYCGNSEVEQQAAMLGLDRELWSNALFRETLPAVCAAGGADVPYVPSSPTGGALPFHVDAGVAHYFGVGAYLRPLEDARHSGVRFASECLGFSNIPEPRAVEALLPNGESPFHHPKWKIRVPRDHGAGWDFEDVRDHYLAQCFGVDPMRLRYADMERYMALSRVVTGDVMARTIGEWRRAGSVCAGAIVWFYQDLWLGAGWGVLDASGRPKAVYYSLKRAMQPVALAITDEGVNGLHVHIANDRGASLDGELRLLLLRGGGTVVASATSAVSATARTTTKVAVDGMLGRFYDSAYAFRFGPPGHDVVAATLVDDAGAVLSEAFHFPHGAPTQQSDEPMLSGHATRTSDTTIEIALRATSFAQAVAIQAGDYVPDDNYFHMTPGSERVIVARASDAAAKFDGFAQALNARDGVRLALVREPRGGDAS